MSKCGFHIVKNKGDVLYPKRTKYSKYRKGRCSKGCKPDGTQLGFGRYGTKSCRAGRLSYRAIEAARRAIIGHFHRAMSGQFRRNGKIWVRVLADLPITGKPTEVRMGKGKKIMVLFFILFSFLGGSSGSRGKLGGLGLV